MALYEYPTATRPQRRGIVSTICGDVVVVVRVMNHQLRRGNNNLTPQVNRPIELSALISRDCCSQRIQNEATCKEQVASQTDESKYACKPLADKALSSCHAAQCTITLSFKSESYPNHSGNS